MTEIAGDYATAWTGERAYLGGAAFDINPDATGADDAQRMGVNMYLQYPEDVHEDSSVRLEVEFLLNLPAGSITEGNLVYNFLTYQDSASGTNYSVACAAVAGESWADVLNYRGENTLLSTDAVNADVQYYLQNAEDQVWRYDDATTDLEDGTTDFDATTDTTSDGAKRNLRAKRERREQAQRAKFQKRKERREADRKLQDTTTAATVDVWTFCDDGSEYQKYCVDGVPDLATICDDVWELSSAGFAGMSFTSVCQVSQADVCARYPELCDNGEVTDDLCSLYPEMCSTSTTQYSSCAANLASCLTDPNFEVCESFPEVCESDEGDFSFDPPLLGAGYPAADFDTFADGRVLTSCTASLEERIDTIQKLIEALNYNLDAGITEGATYDFTATIGARVYASQEAVASTYAAETETAVGTITMPALNGVDEVDDEAEDVADEFFADDEEAAEAYLDVLGSSWIPDGADGVDAAGNRVEDMYQVFSNVRFGYRIPAATSILDTQEVAADGTVVEVETETEPTYIGIDFGLEGPTELL
jgi:hypothetical protein